MAEEEEMEQEAGEAEEQEQEQEVEEVQEKKTKPRPPPKRDEEPEEKQLTEAEMAMLAAKKRHEAEEESKMAEYEEQRRIAREKEEEELRALKEKLERRRAEREEEEAQMAEAKRIAEQRWLEDEEKKRKKAEEAKAKKDAEKAKRLAMMGGAQGGGTGKNFTVNKSGGGAEKFGNIIKKETGPTKDQMDEMKNKALAEFKNPPSFEDMDMTTLRNRIKDMHARISKLEATKYDLEKRSERQAYDLKELGERQRQMNRNKAVKKGLDPDAVAALDSNQPMKIQIINKFDRQIDRRSYSDRRNLYEKPPKKPEPKVFHGSCRPPPKFGRMKNDATNELETILKSGMVNSAKYVEAAPIEGAKPPMAPIPAQPVPEEPEEPEPAAAEPVAAEEEEE